MTLRPQKRLKKHRKREGRKGSKRQRIKEFAVKVCLLLILEVTPLKSLQEADTNSHVTVSSAKLPRLQPNTKNYRQWSKAGSKRSGAPREKHSNCHFCAE